MRDRTMFGSSPTPQVSLAVDGGTLDWNVFGSPGTGEVGFAGPRYYSRISDQLSPDHARYSYNPCDHILSNGADIAQHVVYESGVSYISNLDVDYKFCYDVRNTWYSRPLEPWGSMLDDLASLVEGHHSNATQFPVSLWELGKTIEMIRNPFKLLKPQFRRKVRKLTAAHLAKANANVWLESYYGWKSLYQDVVSSAKALASFLNDPIVRTFESDESARLSVSKLISNENVAFKYDVGTSEEDWNFWLQQGWGVSGPTFHRRKNVSSKLTYTVGCRQYQDAFQRIQNTRRFLRLASLSNWRDIRDVIWEVIPFSFVVDWFVNTRGIWAPLNRWRLSETDIKEVGYTSNFSEQYDVEINLAWPNFLRDTNAVWGWIYRRPVNDINTCILKSSSPGRFSHYVRTPGFPATELVDAKFLSHGLKRIQLLNGAALLLSLGIKP